MALNQRQPILICYDIADPKRLQRLHRQLAKQAVMVQYSVYYTEMRVVEIECLKDMIRQYIDADHDDVRIYPLPDKIEITMIGLSATPSLSVLQRRAIVRKR
ncbi:MAG: CRISPR-associated endonuclease Cas2 [Mariprofundales bacterium]|nr:CRISPR-associated endonuclease Cas2 [Mariprofundales bacterium]